MSRPVLRVEVHPAARDFRPANPRKFVSLLKGATLVSSEARGKLICFRFTGDLWLGIHLGMTGHLRVETEDPEGRDGRETRPPRLPGKHDHLCLHQPGQVLVFNDPRQFGRLLIDRGEAAPLWWAGLPPALLSREFTTDAVAAFLWRHARAPVKGVLLLQERFPGLGNWMVDEVLWRSGIHPACPAGTLSRAEIAVLRREIRAVARVALRRIAQEDEDLPAGWLFHHRWKDGGICPRSGVPLVREHIGGRTTCWSPGVQKCDRPGRPGGFEPTRRTAGGTAGSRPRKRAASRSPSP